jgi:hypothetical protein
MSSNQSALAPPGTPEPPGGQSGILPEDVADEFNEVFPEGYRSQRVEPVIHGPQNYLCYPVDVTVKTDRYKKPAMLEGTAYAPNGQPPQENGGLILLLNGGVVFTGAVNTSSKQANGLVFFRAFDGVRRMNKIPFNKKYKAAPPEKIAKDIFRKAGVRFNEDTVGYSPGPPGLKAPDQRGQSFEGAEFEHNFRGQSCTNAMGELATRASSIWYFDRHNIAHFSTSLENTTHELQNVLKHNAAKQTIPFTKVVIKGEKRSKNGLPQNGVVKGVAGEGRNVFRERINSIHKKRVAQDAAEGILRKFQLQRADGKVEIVGNARIRPLDVIKLPQQFGSEEYGVRAVTHHINNDDGFLTMVDVDGLIDGG